MPREGSTGASAPSTASKGSFDAELDAMFSAPPPAQKPLLHEHDDHAEHGEEDHVDEEDDDDDEEGEDVGTRKETLRKRSDTTSVHDG